MAVTQSVDSVSGHDVNGRTRSLCYYLVDGIYPRWAIFVNTITEAATRKQKCFAKAQEALRKDVERAFGVLISRWHLLAKPCALWDQRVIALTMKAVIILHNMIVEHRRDGYKSDLWSLAESAVSRGVFIDDEGSEREFKWHTRAAINENLSQQIPDEQWASVIVQGRAI